MQVSPCGSASQYTLYTLSTAEKKPVQYEDSMVRRRPHEPRGTGDSLFPHRALPAYPGRRGRSQSSAPPPLLLLPASKRSRCSAPAFLWRPPSVCPTETARLSRRSWALQGVPPGLPVSFYSAGGIGGGLLRAARLQAPPDAQRGTIRRRAPDCPRHRREMGMRPLPAKNRALLDYACRVLPDNLQMPIEELSTRPGFESAPAPGACRRGQIPWEYRGANSGAV